MSANSEIKINIDQLSMFCQQWNQNTQKKSINSNYLIQCFIDNKINRSYFQNHTRKDFILLLKQKCGIKAAASLSLWNSLNLCHHQIETDDYVYIPRDNLSDPYSLQLHRFSELETERQKNKYLEQQLSRHQHQNKFLMKTLRNIIEQIEKFSENNCIDNNQRIQSGLEIQSDWEHDEGL